MQDLKIGEKIKNLRTQNGLSQEALAELSGLSHRTIMRIEKEGKKPSGDSISRIAKALNVSSDYFFRLNTNPNYLLIMAFSPIVFIIYSPLSVIVPLIFWLSKNREIHGCDQIGKKIVKIQAIWFIVYMVLRTINFIRISNFMKLNISDNNYGNNLMTNIDSQYYLKCGFIAINICIIFYFTYKTYQFNQKQNF
jgi:DNA-binding XRE family transcriptional regulator